MVLRFATKGGDYTMAKGHQLKTKLVVLTNLKLEIGQLGVSETRKRSLVAAVTEVLRFIKSGTTMTNFWRKTSWLIQLVKIIKNQMGNS